MSKSKLRGGKKAHNKRVKLRNQNIVTKRKKMEDEYNKMMKDAYDKFLASNPTISGETDTQSTEEGKLEVSNEVERGITITSSEDEKPAEVNVDYKPTNPTQGLL